MNITNGKQKQPIKAVVYGPEGIGKSTFASHWPKPLYIDTEGSTARMDVNRAPKPTSWGQLIAMVKELTADCHGMQTLVVDTADWADKLCAQHVCDSNGKTSIEAIGYGKGWVMVSEEWKKFLDAVNMLMERQGMHVLFLGHAQMRKFEQPDEAGSYDRWELKMEKKSSSLLKEWADLVLFSNYKTLVVEVEGKKKAQGGKRVMHTQHHPCWDAKNRFALAEELDFSFSEITKIVAACTTEHKAEPKAEPVKQVLTTVDPDALPGLAEPAKPVEDPEKARLLAQLKDLMKTSGVTTEELGIEMARKGVCPAGMRPPAWNIDTLKKVVTHWDKIVHNITNIIRKGVI